MSHLSANNGDELHAKIMKIIASLEQEMMTLRAAQTAELEQLTLKCRQDIQKLQRDFSEEIDSINARHKEKISSLAEEIDYLKEMSHSQRMMMESNLEYLRELELRHTKS